MQKEFWYLCENLRMTFIKNIEKDNNPESKDFAVGTDDATGKTFSYQFDTLFAKLGTQLLSTVSVRQITITETLTEDFLQVINEDVSGIPIYASEVVVIEVLDNLSAFKALYLLHKVNVTGTVTYGLNQTQMLITDLTIIRDISEIGEINTASSLGTGEPIFSSKQLVDLEFKSLKAGTNITVTTPVSGEVLISFTGTLGEVNTASSIGIGTVDIIKDKNVSDLRFHTLEFEGAYVNLFGDPDTIPIRIWKKVKVASAPLMNANSTNTTYWIDNGAVNLNISLPVGLDAEFQCAFYQMGTGDVKFIPSVGVTLLGGNNAISGRYGSAWLESDPDTSDQYAFFGDVKFIP